MEIAWSANLLWRIFEATGSVWAYMAYRRLARRAVFLPVSMN